MSVPLSIIDSTGEGHFLFLLYHINVCCTTVEGNFLFLLPHSNVFCTTVEGHFLFLLPHSNVFCTTVKGHFLFLLPHSNVCYTTGEGYFLVVITPINVFSTREGYFSCLQRQTHQQLLVPGLEGAHSVTWNPHSFAGQVTEEAVSRNILAWFSCQNLLG